MLAEYRAQWKVQQQQTQYEKTKQAYLEATDEGLKVNWYCKLKALERRLNASEVIPYGY